MLEYNEFSLTLIRHGQSIVNATPDLMGQASDTELSKLGEKQAWLVGERLSVAKERPDLVFSSTYTRAYNTALIALDHFRDIPKIELVEDLREYDAGDWIGASRKKTLTATIKQKMNSLNNSFLPPNGESLQQVERRVSKWLEDRILYNANICEQAVDRKTNGLQPLNILCFSHGMTIKCILLYIMGFDRSFTWKINLDNTSITKLYFGKDGWKLNCINDCSHLIDI